MAPQIVRRKGKILTEEQRISRNQKQLRRLNYRDDRHKMRTKWLKTLFANLALAAAGAN